MPFATVDYLARAAGAYDPSLSLSADGRWLAYVSYADATRLGSVFVRDTVSGATRALTASLAGSESYSAALAAGGAALAFTTVTPGWGGMERIGVMDLGSGALRFASTNSAGVSANGDSRFASISADGRYVAFESAASNLVDGDSNGADDVFVKDMLSGAVQRVSLGATGAQLAGGAAGALISADGNVVLFRALGAVMAGAAQASSHQLYAKNLATGVLTMVSANAAGQPSEAIGEVAALSADGRYVVFSTASNLAGDANANVDVFRKDLVTGSVQLVSTSSSAVQGQGWAATPAISADGRLVSFAYNAADLSGGPRSATSEIYVKDMQSGALSVVSHGAEPDQGSFAPAFSADGAHLAFITYAGTEGANYDVSWNVMLATLPAPTGGAAPAPVPGQGMSATWTGSGSGAALVSTSANDSLRGGAGLDTISYRGNAADYEIRVSGAAAQVSDRNLWRDGDDTLDSVERLQFADTMVALDSGAHGVAGQAYRIYQAAFNRAPDAVGLGFWIASMDQGESLQKVAAGFVRSDEFTGMYGAAPSNAQVVDLLYQNVLHRPGEAGGVAYWNNVLDQGQANVAQVLASFSESAENVAALVGVLEHGFAYTYFGG